MIRYAIVEGSGLVIGEGEAMNMSEAQASALGGEAFPAPWDAEILPNRTVYFHGEFHQIEPPPSHRHRWMGSAWIDPRTPAERQAALYAAREATERDKSGLLMDLRLMGVLTAQEARQAALGVIPASFEAALASLPEEAQDAAHIKWAGDQTISRMNPLIVLAAYAKGIDDDQLDAAFGVPIPE